MGHGVHKVSPRGPLAAGAIPTARPLFLNIDDDPGFTQFLGQALVLPAKSLHLLVLRIAFRLGAALGGVKSLRTPACRSRRQVTKCEECRPSRRSKAPMAPGWVTAASASARIRCLYSAVKVPALGVGDNLRVRARRGRRLGRYGFAGRCTPVGNGQNRGGRRRASVVLHMISVLALLSNYDLENCLIIWHGGGLLRCQQPPAARVPDSSRYTGFHRIPRQPNRCRCAIVWAETELDTKWTPRADTKRECERARLSGSAWCLFSGQSG